MKSTAVECNFDGTVAIKVCQLKPLPPNVSRKLSVDPPEFKAQREARILTTVRHNHIVAILGTYKNNQSFGIVMFPVAAWDMWKYLKMISDFNIEEKTRNPSRPRAHPYITHLRGFFACLLNALQHVHNNIIKHKDIKPSDILIDVFHTVMLADFGIAKIYQTTEQTFTDGTLDRTSRICAY